MKISIIVAADENGCIGKDGKLPWHFKEDMQWFKKLTDGKAVIFGRKTIESLPKKLENRFVCRISSSRVVPSDSFFDQNCTNLDNAIDVCRYKGFDHCFIGGGAQIYRQALDVAHDIILTKVPGKYDGDVYFPDWPLNNWVLFDEVTVPNEHGLRFCYFKRIFPNP